MGREERRLLASAKEAMNDREYQDFRRRADYICLLIVSSDVPEVDIEIEKNKLRTEVEDNWPEKLRLYEMIFESRFDRLWQQWRQTDR
jgi:hypothetical protein